MSIDLEQHRRTVRLPEGDVSFCDVGDGPIALFVHGVFMNAHLWRHVVDQASQDRRCIAVDLPAHGRTRLHPGADLSLPAQASLLASLCHELGVDQVDLVGNDTGGAVCQVFAAGYPQLLRTLTLTNCDAHDNLPPANFQQVVDLAASGDLAPVIRQLAADPDLARSEIGLGSGYEHADRLSDDDVRRFLEPVGGTEEAARTLEAYINALNGADLLEAEPALRALDVPTLLVWGTGDQFFELSWAHWLLDLIPGATEVVEVPGAKLFFPDERPAELLEPMRRHWRAHAGRSSIDAAGAGAGAAVAAD